ncbi:MAG: FtsX-like permease family protein, partial [Clostridia bacterium]|nr:FtsX-like permease family protein [Clostridia bacterium]
DGLTIELSARETGDEPIIFTVVGAVNSRYTTRIYVSKSTYNNNIMPLFEGYSYIISNLTGNDEAFIKYCETYNDEGVKFIVQNSATSILDMLEDVIVYTAKIFLYIAIGFALFASFLLMNFISTSIAHKKREIGVLRALGARGSDIFGIFLNESTVISLINFALSAIATFIICYFINVALLAKLGIDIVLLTPGIRQFILILAISWGSAFISSLIPSMKISKKKPIDAINNR